jgi:tetratricopeptide (TPR) repeat protein
MEGEEPTVKTAEEWKSEGNEAFKQKNYAKAIQDYSQAIASNPQEYSFYSNRALCFFNTQQYQ